MLIVPAVAVGAHLGGLDGAAAAVLFVNAAFGIPLLAGMMRLLHVPVREFADAILRPAVGWALLAASLLVLRPLVDELPSGLALIALSVWAPLSTPSSSRCSRATSS